MTVAHCGAHWLIPTLDLVKVTVLEDGRIKIHIDATAEQVAAAHKDAIKSSAPPQLVKENEDKAKAAAASAQTNGVQANGVH